MSRVAIEEQHTCLCNAPLASVPAGRHTHSKLRHTFLADVPRTLSENCARLHWLGFTPPH